MKIRGRKSCEWLICAICVSAVTVRVKCAIMNAIQLQKVEI